MESDRGKLLRVSSAFVTEVISQLQSRMEHGLFPLPLTPFEKYLWWDDSLEHPLCNFIELEFDGSVDHATMQSAIQIAVHLHPLLSSRLELQRNHWQWCYDEGFRPKLLSTQEYEVAPYSRLRQMDLTQQPGLLAWRITEAAGDRLLFQFHHACCDGNGFRRFLLDVLSIYVHLRKPGDGPVVDFVATITKRWEPMLLRQRFDFSAAWGGPPRRPHSLWRKLKNAYYFHFQLPEPLAFHVSGNATAASTTHGPQSSPSYPFLKHVLDRQLTERILEHCQLKGVRINALALTLLFQTSVRWQRDQLGPKPKRRLRLLMPYALLSRADLRMPGTNRLSFSFLGRTESECEDQSYLLLSIQQEIAAMRESQLPMDFLYGMQAASRWPALMKWGLRRSNNMCTSLLSYGGDIARGRGHSLPIVDGKLDVGDCKLLHVFGAPPVRVNTNIALGVCISGGELCIALSWSRRAMSAQQAKHFLSRYVEAWQVTT